MHSTTSLLPSKTNLFTTWNSESWNNKRMVIENSQKKKVRESRWKNWERRTGPTSTGPRSPGYKCGPGGGGSQEQASQSESHQTCLQENQTADTRVPRRRLQHLLKKCYLFRFMSKKKNLQKCRNFPEFPYASGGGGWKLSWIHRR